MQTVELWAIEDILSHAEQALALTPGLGSQSIYRIAAITDFVFNLGAGRYRGSTLRRRILAGKWEEAPRELRRWVFGGGQKLPGLVLRREVNAAWIWA